VTLDAYLAGERIAANRVRFVKIDVEGFEFEVIRGMPLVVEARPLVVTEFSPVYMRRSGVDPAEFLWFFGSRDTARIAFGIEH